MRQPFAMRATRLAVGLALALGGSQMAQAIGLQQALELAMKNDPTYRAAIFENAAGQENRALGRANLLPQLSYSYSASRNRADQEADSLYGRSTTHPQYMSRSSYLSLRQPLVNDEGLARFRQGRLQADLSDAVFASRAQDLILRLVGAYIEALFAEEQLRLSTAQRNFYAEQKLVNERSFASGEAARTDVLETQAKLDTAEAQVLEAQDNVRATRLALGQIIGKEVDGVDKLAEGFKAVAVDDKFSDWSERARRLNPDIVAQNYSVELAQQEIARAKAGHQPRIDFVASYGKGSSETINTYNQDTTSRSVGVQIQVPLFSGGAVSASARQAVANKEKSLADLQARVDKVMLDLRKAYDTVVSSTAKVAALEKAVASSTLLVEATEKSIKGGVRINLDLLNAQTQRFQNLRDLSQARFNYLVNLMRLRAGAGALGPADVKEIAAFFR
ncbi:TolC family outer membrane protein [Massilia sp. TS11]|uniref:TolC family outer membrane protein n=1 Tax=Massilia sp. TS11 TaxID=2908003 RepID=UPI001EDC205D|nr:TolC family outer membrane protein [Massilia sp. TS11]MCG2583632.1 TolC family outer membrane protein [Massilia sp. TS11]